MSTLVGNNANHLMMPPLAGRRTSRSVRIGVLLTAIAILNGLDLLYTIFAQKIGMLDELNPLIATMLRPGLYGGAIVFKIAMVAVGLGILWRLRHNRWTLPACWVLLCTYVVLGAVWVQWVRLINYSFEVRLSSALP